MRSNKSNLIIWDYPNKDPVQLAFSELIFWRSFSKQKKIVSIPLLIEKWSDEIRKEYLDWIYKLGKYRTGGKTLIESLKIRNKFSAWWFGLIIEKSNFSKSKYIDDVIRVLTFKKWIKNKKFDKLTLYSSNLNLADCLKKYCKNNQINFELINIKNEKPYQENQENNNLKNFFFNLPYTFKAFIWLFYKILYNLPLIFLRIKKSKKDKKNYIFFSYLFNMKNTDTDNFLHSTYWGELPAKLKSDKKYSTWIHLYVKDKYLSNPYRAAKIIKSLNNNNNFQTHSTLFSFMNYRVIYKVIFDWLSLYIKIKKIKLDKKFPTYKGFNFWGFYKNDWYESFIGISAIENLIYLALFEEVIKSCHQKSKITYLLENQGWEIAMLSACRSYGINKTIGFSHATSRYWDLRNFYDLREYMSKKLLRLPRPKILAVNSKNVLFEFLKYGYPKSEIRLVEALRHSYLNSSNIKRLNKNKKNKTLLLLGDYEDKNTKYQLSVLNQISRDQLNSLEIIFKPHPASILNIKSFTSLKIRIMEEPISDLLPLAKIVFCGSITSASVDAFSYGLKVIVLIDPKILNLSPLRNFKKVSFVKDSKELEKVIIKFFSENIYYVSQRVIFELSEDLPLWKKLLY